MSGRSGRTTSGMSVDKDIGVNRCPRLAHGDGVVEVHRSRRLKSGDRAGYGSTSVVRPNAVEPGSLPIGRRHTKFTMSRQRLARLPA
jgi:hypothetical protein